MLNKYGIDYGTTNSSIALSYMDNGVAKTVVVPVEDTIPKGVMPSKVLITGTGYATGRFEAQSSNVANIVRRPKDYLAPKKDYQISGDENAAPPQETIDKNGKEYKTKDLIAAVFKKLLAKAKPVAKELGIETKGVVLGVPVEYGEEQKRVLKEALVEAGFYEEYEEADAKTEFVSEPVAVAVDYGLKITDNINVLVFDFGGGTLDIAVMNLKNDVSKINRDHLHPHNVIIKEGADIGGELMTKSFFVNAFFERGKYTVYEFSRVFGLTGVKTPLELWNGIINLGNEGDRFFEAVDQLKCDLSSVLRKGFDYTGPRGSLKKIVFDRQDFETALNKPIEGTSDTVFDRIDNLINRVMENPKIDGVSDIDSVVLAGGSSMIPCIRQYLYDKFPGQLHVKVGQTDALSSIVRGLSLVGCREESILDDIVDNDYGFWDVGQKAFCPIISKNTRVLDTSFDKTKNTGKYIEFRNNNPRSTQMDIQVMQHNKYGVSELGVIQLSGTDDRTYRLYMTVDKKLGILKCFVYDTKNKVFLDDTGMVTSLECQFKLKK